jgi:TRAP-type C4-dicarboxylate transport system permease small subunit
MNDAPNEFTAPAPDCADAIPRNGFIDRVIALNMAWCELLVLAMMLTIAIDVFTRVVFDYSWQMSDEIAGYLLVALVFSSLSGGVRDGTFLRVDFLFVRLNERTQRMLDGVYAMLGLIFVGVWTYQLGRLV